MLTAVRRKHLADADILEVLRGKHRVEREIKLARVLLARRGNRAESIGSVRFAHVGNVRIQRRNLHLRYDSVVRVRNKQKVAALAQAKVRAKRAVLALFLGGRRVENFVFAGGDGRVLWEHELMQIAQIIRNAIAGEVNHFRSGVVEFNPVRRAKRSVHERALVAGDNLVDHEPAAGSGFVAGARKQQRQECRRDDAKNECFFRLYLHVVLILT